MNFEDVKQKFEKVLNKSANDIKFIGGMTIKTILLFATMINLFLDFLEKMQIA